jgi:predicted alpha/beta-fold hydrolase
VPFDLETSADSLARPINRFYRNRFLRSLQHKIHRMADAFPEQVDANGVEEITNVKVFDELYTAPLHGFRDGADYRAQCSCGPIFHRVRIPTLVVNAANDSFLSPQCYPYEVCRENANLFLEVPESGGHCGFVDLRGGEYWSETRARDFLAEMTP